MSSISHVPQVVNNGCVVDISALVGSCAKVEVKVHTPHQIKKEPDCIVVQPTESKQVYKKPGSRRNPEALQARYDVCAAGPIGVDSDTMAQLSLLPPDILLKYLQIVIGVTGEQKREAKDGNPAVVVEVGDKGRIAKATALGNDHIVKLNVPGRTSAGGKRDVKTPLVHAQVGKNGEILDGKVLGDKVLDINAFRGSRVKGARDLVDAEGKGHLKVGSKGARDLGPINANVAGKHSDDTATIVDLEAITSKDGKIGQDGLINLSLLGKKPKGKNFLINANLLAKPDTDRNGNGGNGGNGNGGNGNNGNGGNGSNGNGGNGNGGNGNNGNGGNGNNGNSGNGNGGNGPNGGNNGGNGPNGGGPGNGGNGPNGGGPNGGNNGGNGGNGPNGGGPNGGNNGTGNTGTGNNGNGNSGNNNNGNGNSGNGNNGNGNSGNGNNGNGNSGNGNNGNGNSGSGNNGNGQGGNGHNGNGKGDGKGNHGTGNTGTGNNGNGNSGNNNNGNGNSGNGNNGNGNSGNGNNGNGNSGNGNNGNGNSGNGHNGSGGNGSGSGSGSGKGNNGTGNTGSGNNGNNNSGNGNNGNGNSGNGNNGNGNSGNGNNGNGNSGNGNNGNGHSGNGQNGPGSGHGNGSGSVPVPAPGHFTTYYQPNCGKGLKQKDLDRATKQHAADVHHCLAICQAHGALATVHGNVKVGDTANVKVCVIVDFDSSSKGDGNCRFITGPDSDRFDHGQLEDKHNGSCFLRQ